MIKNILKFDISIREKRKWLTDLLYELQNSGVNFIVSQDANIVYVEIK